MAVSFLQNVRAQTVRCVEEIAYLFPGIGTDPESSVNVGGEAGFFLLHGRPDVTVKVVWPSTCGPKLNESPDFRVPILVVRHAGGREVDGMNFKFKSRTREKISRHVDAFLVLDHEVEFQ